MKQIIFDRIRSCFEGLVLLIIIWLFLLTTGVIFNTFRINDLISSKTSDRYTGTDAKRDIATMKRFINEGK